MPLPEENGFGFSTGAFAIFTIFRERALARISLSTRWQRCLVCLFVSIKLSSPWSCRQSNFRCMRKLLQQIMYLHREFTIWASREIVPHKHIRCMRACRIEYFPTDGCEWYYYYIAVTAHSNGYKIYTKRRRTPKIAHFVYGLATIVISW